MDQPTSPEWQRSRFPGARPRKACYSAMDQPTSPEWQRSRFHRWITIAFGLLFVLLGIAIGLLGNTLGAWLAATLLVALGIDNIVGAWRGRPTLLSKIGLLP